MLLEEIVEVEPQAAHLNVVRKMGPDKGLVLQDSLPKNGELRGDIIHFYGSVETTPLKPLRNCPGSDGQNHASPYVRVKIDDALTKKCCTEDTHSPSESETDVSAHVVEQKSQDAGRAPE